jgi:thiosulfate/3-mercaptopyruvate sulfurtransferase
MAFETLIDADSLRSLLAGSHEPLVLDCRFDLSDPAAGRRAYAQGHIPKALYADLNQDLSAPVTPSSGRHPLPERVAFAATLKRWGVTESRQVIAYDAQNSSFAARLWWMLHWVGHRACAVLDGGFQAWLAAGGASEAGSERSVSASAALQIATDADFATLDAAAVAARIPDRSLLIDARAAERYSGAVEPIDRLAGHVPGAVNHPFSTSLAPDGRFLAAEELHRRWQARLNGRGAEEIIAMCGSGVTACHNLLSLKIAGLSGARLYPGSWSEWIADPQRPVARGDAP